MYQGLKLDCIRLKTAKKGYVEEKLTFCMNFFHSKSHPCVVVMGLFPGTLCWQKKLVDGTSFLLPLFSWFRMFQYQAVMQLCNPFPIRHCNDIPRD